MNGVKAADGWRLPCSETGGDFLTAGAIDCSRAFVQGLRDSVKISKRCRCMGIAVKNEGFR
jgi:hypothetical protein